MRVPTWTHFAKGVSVLPQSNFTFVLAAKSLIITMILSSSSVAANMTTAQVAFDFSSDYAIDREQLAVGDDTKPLFFNLLPPPDLDAATAFGFTADIGTQFDVWFSDRRSESNPLPNARSLGIKITSDKDLNVKDKIFLSVVPQSSQIHLTVDSHQPTRYISFDMMLDEHYEVPNVWAMHFQAWQCCGGHPPFTINVEPGMRKDGPVTLSFGFRDDHLENSKGYPEHILYKFEAKRGVWHQFIMAFNPQSDASRVEGVLKLWIDHKECYSFTGQWAYDPTQQMANGHRLLAQMGLELGTYRRRQATTQTVYFDKVRVSEDLQSVW